MGSRGQAISRGTEIKGIPKTMAVAIPRMAAVQQAGLQSVMVGGRERSEREASRKKGEEKETDRLSQCSTLLERTSVFHRRIWGRINDKHMKN